MNSTRPRCVRQQRDLVGRHDVLRTRYPGTPPVQVVDPPTSVTMETRLVADIEVEVLLREFGSRGFDVAADLPVRWMLLQVSPVRHVLAVSFHHIAVDGVSMRTVGRRPADRVRQATSWDWIRNGLRCRSSTGILPRGRQHVTFPLASSSSGAERWTV